MYEVKYEYAIDEFGVYTHIKDVDKNKSYHLLVYGDKIDMIPAMGKINQWHFRTKNNQHAGMSPEHWNLQAKLIAEKSFYSREFDITITANDAKREYKLSNGRIVDVAYFDTNNDFLCGIEVVNTNDIDYEKFQDLYNSNYLIFKVYTRALGRITYVDNKEINEECNRLFKAVETDYFTELEYSKGILNISAPLLQKDLRLLIIKKLTYNAIDYKKSVVKSISKNWTFNDAINHKKYLPIWYINQRNEKYDKYLKHWY